MGALSSLTRNRTHTPCIARRILNYRAIREVPWVFWTDHFPELTWIFLQQAPPTWAFTTSWTSLPAWCPSPLWRHRMRRNWPSIKATTEIAWTKISWRSVSLSASSAVGVGWGWSLLVFALYHLSYSFTPSPKTHYFDLQVSLCPCQGRILCKSSGFLDTSVGKVGPRDRAGEARWRLGYCEDYKVKGLVSRSLCNWTGHSFFSRKTRFGLPLWLSW